MAETSFRNIFCEGEGEGERGERGKRGKRGKRGHDGTPGTSEGALIGRQVFNAAGSGTYTPTPGTRRAIVRGVGGGGGGGGAPPTGANGAEAASGGNSGVAIETEVVAAPNTLLTGGPFTVGAGGVGTGNNGTNGGDSTITINGVTLTAPGGVGGNTSGFGALPPVIVQPSAQPPATGVDYSASDLGGSGFALATGPTSSGLQGGTGGSGDYGIGGLGALFFPGNGADATGNGAGGGGAANSSSQPNFVLGGAGSPGLWIVEEYS
jgi:hypothetical protein